MKNVALFATNKIMLLIISICMAIMASVLIYHARQEPVKPVLPSDIGLLFPAPRDIKPFELMTAGHEKFTQKNFYDHWTVLFFGFTHCASICPTTLDVMKHVYPKLHDQYPNLQFVFISIDPERDTPVALAQYVHSFHPDFIAVTGKIQDVRKLQGQLGVYSEEDPTTGQGSANPSMDKKVNYQLLHTATMMLIDPHGNWVGIFNYGLKPDELIQGIKTSMQHQEV